MNMKLEKLLNSTAVRLSDPAGMETLITGISCDSRNVREGNLFAALPGVKSNGAEFRQTSRSQRRSRDSV